LPLLGTLLTMAALRTAIALSALMCLASVFAALSQVAPLVKEVPSASIQLESAIPRQFGRWRMEPGTSMVVNPQTQQVLDRLYGQVLSRAYTDERGYRIMLSVVYGSDQRGALQAHKPEVCYVAQGFKLLSTDPSDIDTPFGRISGQRVRTQLGPRVEPITYWFTIGDHAVRSRFERRLAEVRIGLTGRVPDGVLFRVSSIDPEPGRAWREQDQFVNELLKAVHPSDRTRLSGLNGVSP
jgi:EpsI family protein